MEQSVLMPDDHATHSLNPSQSQGGKGQSMDTELAHTLPMRSPSQLSDPLHDSLAMSINDTPPSAGGSHLSRTRNRRDQRNTHSKRSMFLSLRSAKLRTPWNDNVKGLLLRKLRNNRETNAIRYIRRDKLAEANVLSDGFLASKGWRYLYFKLVDRAWLLLLCELFALYAAMYVAFATVAYYAQMAYVASSDAAVLALFRHNYWFLCFNFAVQLGTSIGYGVLLPTGGYGALLLSLVLVYCTELFEVLFREKLQIARCRVAVFIRARGQPSNVLKKRELLLHSNDGDDALDVTRQPMAPEPFRHLRL